MAPTLSTARGLRNVVPHSENESSSLTLCGIKFMDSHTDNASYPMLAHVPRVLSLTPIHTHTHRHCEIPYGRNVQELPNQYSTYSKKLISAIMLKERKPINFSS